MTTILGINAFHADSSACIVRDGVMLAAAEEERFRRVKHWGGFPSLAIAYCLRAAGLRLADLDHVAVNQDTRANLAARAAYAVTRRPDLPMLLSRLRNRQQRADIADHLAKAFPGERLGAKVHAVEHHLAHMSSAFHVSPFDRAAIVSVDGFGDFASAAWGIGSGCELSVEGRVLFPHSLGIFYQALTQFIGFPNYGDEYKVMGLAPYGRPLFMEQMRRIVKLQGDGGFRLDLDFFRHHAGAIDVASDDGSPRFAALFSDAITELLGPARQLGEELTQRHKDIAHSAQQMYEEAFFHLLNVLHERYRVDAVALSGGCAMNSVANGKVTRRTPFTRVYVQSAAGDAGGAVGAAYAVWHRLGGSRGPVHEHAYWGPEFTTSEIDATLALRRHDIESAGCVIEPPRALPDLCHDTAASIARGEVVGWFQGRMEWGPRALGNRSILGDPRRADMKDILNLKIKRRESFRPFAPSILRDAVPEWFEVDADVPFMMQVLPIREDKRSLVPAVTHVDGSGRLQTVTAAANPRYHALISAFHRQTGVPLVLNTSFNENEPVVCTPAEALDCFLRTHMDLLVLGDRVIRRREAP